MSSNVGFMRFLGDLFITFLSLVAHLDDIGLNVGIRAARVGVAMQDALQIFR